MFITNGPVADVLLVYAKTAPEKGPRYFGFIVEKVSRVFSRTKLVKMGWRGSETGELVLITVKFLQKTWLAKKITAA